MPGQRAGVPGGFDHIQAQREAFAGIHAPAALIGGEVSAGAGINQAEWPMGCAGAGRDFFSDLAARAKTGIDQACTIQCVERLAIIIEMIGLAAHRSIPGQSQPGDIVEDGLFEFGPAAIAVQVLDTQQENSVRFGTGGAPTLQGRPGMADMEQTGWAGRKSCGERSGCHGPGLWRALISAAMPNPAISKPATRFSQTMTPAVTRRRTRVMTPHSKIHHTSEPKKTPDVMVIAAP